MAQTTVPGSQLRTAYINVDGSVAFTGDQSLGGHLLTNLGDAVNAQDAVNLRTAQGMIQGVSAFHEAKALKDSNVAALTGTVTVDGIALAAGDILLLTGQTTPSQNGLWTIAAGAWARPAGYPSGGKADGNYVFVKSGTAYGATGWIPSGTGLTIDTTAVTFVQFTGAGDITPNAPLAKSGNQLSLTLDGVTLHVNGSSQLEVLAIAASLITGVIARTNLGSGSSGSTTFLRGDSTWAVTPFQYREDFTGNGATLNFDMTNTNAGGMVLVFLNGVLQRGGGNDYTYTANGGAGSHGRVAMTTAPGASDILSIVY